MRRRLGARADLILTKRRIQDTVRHFDTIIKRQFNPFDDDCDSEFEIPLVGVADVPEIDLNDGYLKLSR